ncbi:MAG: release factor glutamine methyltransferase [Bacteroidetes bacterium]|nr:MAG: release factor glutamine methyltransferase [Bacteroidota bacterium]
MRIASNKVKDIIAFFRQELHDLYDEAEIDRFVEICFEEYAGYSRLDVLNRQDATVNESDLLKFNFAVKDLKRGRPIQHITGKAWFFDITLTVNEHVLIPRPETEELVQWIVDDHRKEVPSISMLDIGTGSGCIAIVLKRKLPKNHVYALDVSSEALALAKQNALQGQADVHFIQSDILDRSGWSKLPSCAVIVSNPPYVRKSEKEAMHKNVVDFEPHTALFVPDEDALIFYKTIGELGLEKLKPGGHLYFEINENLGLEVCILLQKLGYKDVQLRQDMSGKDRMVRSTHNP